MNTGPRCVPNVQVDGLEVGENFSGGNFVLKHPQCFEEATTVLSDLVLNETQSKH